MKEGLPWSAWENEVIFRYGCVLHSEKLGDFLFRGKSMCTVPRKWESCLLFWRNEKVAIARTQSGSSISKNRQSSTIVA
jgi:hypothetical protein